MGAHRIRRVHLSGRSLAWAASLAVLAAACSSAATGPSGSRDVHFTTADGIRLEGRLFGEGGAGVVLSHMFPSDESSWFGFAQRLAGKGYMALAYDFRGYCPGGDAGCSRGPKDVPATWNDVVAATAFLRDHGATKVMLVGASMGGTASLVAAAVGGVNASAVVTLSAHASFEGLTVDENALQQVSEPKLFIAGVGDPSGAAAAAQQLYDASTGGKRIEIVPANEHGTDLLTGARGPDVENLIVSFLDEFRGAGS